jgi:hypothetical protein
MAGEGIFSFLSISCVMYFALHTFFSLRYFTPGEVSYRALKSALSLAFIAIVLVLRFLEPRLAAFIKPFRVRRFSEMGTIDAFRAQCVRGC